MKFFLQLPVIFFLRMLGLLQIQY